MRFSKFVPITKVDAARREVWGVATAELPDKDGEVCDYASTKPLYQAWSAEIAKATGGKSLGNVREMHEPSAVGKVVHIEFDDESKAIRLGAKIVDDEAWRKCAAGVYTGFSQGGRYLKTWQDPDDEDLTRYTAEPSEVSVVDNPALPAAHFEFVKADGTVEMRKFSKATRTKRVAGEDLPASAFAYVGDPERTETWKLPIEFSDEEETKSHIRNALARFGQTEGIPEAEKPKVYARIVRAAKEHGIKVSREEKAAAALALRKSLSEVASLADLLQCLGCMQQSLEAERAFEGDDSAIPDDLQAIVKELGALLVALTEEETQELTALTAQKGLSMSLMSSSLGKAARVREHARKMHKLHKEQDDNFEKLHKLLGGEEEEKAAPAEEDDDEEEKERKREERRAREREEEEDEEKERKRHKSSGHDARLDRIEKSLDSVIEAQHLMAAAVVGAKAAVNGAGVAGVTKSKDNGAAQTGADDPLSLIKAELASGGRPYTR